MPSTRADPRVVARESLANGLELVRQPAPPGSRSVSLTYVGPAGWGYDPPGEQGLALATTQLLTSGAGPWDRVAFDRRVDLLGATIARSCHPESSEVTVWGPRAVWPALADLLAQVVLRPRFAASDLERVRRQIFERQLRERTQPDSRAESELDRAVFPPRHPYRESGLGTRRSVSAVHRSSVVAFHRRHFTPEAGLLVTTGGPGLKELSRWTRRHLNEWPVAHAPQAPTIPPLRARPIPKRVLSLPGRSQVEIRIGGPSIARSSDMFPAVTLANEVLGGRPLISRLFQNLREKHGLAYHSSSEVQAMRWGGYWQASAGTGPERVEPTLRLLLEEVGRLSHESVRSAELDEVRESAIGELPLALETTAGAHDLAVDIAYHHLPDDFLRTWPDALRGVTPSALRNGAEVGLDLGRAVTVVAGPPPPRAPSSASRRR